MRHRRHLTARRSTREDRRQEGELAGMLSLVGHRQGRKVIRWGYVLLTGFSFTSLSMLVAAGLYYLLSQQWDPLVLIVGAVAGITATVLTLLTALRTPLQRLPLLKWF